MATHTTAAKAAPHAAGFDVHVYEQAATLGEVGADVQVSPNASRILHRVGLAEQLAATGVKPLAIHQRRWEDGRTLLRSPLAAAFPAERVQFNHRLVGLTDHDDNDRVTARFASGQEAEVDVLVGADGIHSAVRTLLFGPQAPRFTGCAAYRGLIPAERLRHLDLETTAQAWMGPGRHFVHSVALRARRRGHRAGPLPDPAESYAAELI